jgi:ABC-type Fe3+-hydroxamate transport system substrate-binding protein
MIRTLGAMVGESERADQLVRGLESRLAETRKHAQRLKDRVVTTEEVVALVPDLIIGSWCGNQFARGASVCENLAAFKRADTTARSRGAVPVVTLPESRVAALMNAL